MLGSILIYRYWSVILYMYAGIILYMDMICDAVDLRM